MLFINIINWIIYIILFLCVGYLFLFSIASLFYKEKIYSETPKKSHFLVLFPAYAEDSVIINSVENFLKQDYPKNLFQISVISDHQNDKTNILLQQLPIHTIIASYSNSSKAKALKLGIENTNDEFDTVVILDADNIAPNNFLNEINKIRVAGIKAIQVHRKASNDNTSPISILDEISEEINNSIFREGHQAIGLSCGLTGSGMAFDYKWFKKHIQLTSSTGEDKEFELMLLKEKIHIMYSKHTFIYDKKTNKSKAIINQRKRWTAALYYILKKSLPYTPKAITTCNINYIDKVFQWMLPPRLIQISLVLGITIIYSLVNLSVYNKWIFLSVLQILAMLIPVPRKYWNKKTLFAITQIPFLTINIFINLFRLKGASSKFIHTKH